MLDLLLGSVKENAKREYDNYDFESGTRKKDLGDHIGDFLTGRGSAIDEAVKKEHLRRLENDYGVAADEARTMLGSGASKLPQFTENTDPNKVKQELQRLAPKVQGVRDAKNFGARSGIALDPTAYGGDADAMTADVTRQVEEKAEAKESKNRKRETDLILLKMLQNDRQADRDFDLRQSQQAYQNRALDLKEARLDRKDRQAAIQQMMAGLAQMGASIAI